MRTFFYMPPLPHATGGMMVIAELANQLAECSCNVGIVANRELPDDLRINQGVQIFEFASLDLEAGDRWIVPEGWPNALAPGLEKHARCCVYVQNWAYLHGALPPNVQWRKLPLRMLAVSEPVAAFIRGTTGIDAPVISPFLDNNSFYPLERDAESFEKIVISWMPRKNRAMARQIASIFAAMADLADFPPIIWQEIHGLERQEVAGKLRKSQIFLATGFPEGFALPPLEAMSCGNIVCGFAGIGGWDYMRQAMPHGYLPEFPLRQRSWGGNGFYAADADTWGAARCLEMAVKILTAPSDSLSSLMENVLKTATHYSKENQRKQILEVWQDDGFWR